MWKIQITKLKLRLMKCTCFYDQEGVLFDGEGGETVFSCQR